MTLREDLDELSLLVPDAPTLTAGVLEKARELGAESAALVMDAAAWQAEAGALLGRLESELGLLAADAKEAQETVESGVALVLEGFAAMLEALRERRADLATKESATETAVRTAAAAAATAATYVETASESASAAAAEQYEEFEEQRVALEEALSVTEMLPDLGDEARSASSAARSSSSTIVGQLQRLGPLAKGHLTDGEEAVQAQLAELCDAVEGVIASYASAADAMAEALFDDALGPDVITASGKADAEAYEASEALVPRAEQLARAGESFVAEQDALEAQCESLKPYAEEAYRVEERVTGAR